LNDALKNSGHHQNHQSISHWPNHHHTNGNLTTSGNSHKDMIAEAKKFSFGASGVAESKDRTTVRSSIKEEWESVHKASPKKPAQKDTKKIPKKKAEEKPLDVMTILHGKNEKPAQSRQTGNFGGKLLEGPHIMLVTDEKRRRSELMKELDQHHANIMSSIGTSMISEIQKEGTVHSDIKNMNMEGANYDHINDEDIDVGPMYFQRQKNQAALLQNYVDTEFRGSIHHQIGDEKFYMKYEEPDEEDDIPEEKVEGLHDHLTCDTRLRKRRLHADH